MQQAARVSQRTAFFHLGILVEEGATDEIFTNPEGQAHAGLHHRPLRLIRHLRRKEHATMNEHIVKSYESELAQLDRKVAQMGGLAEQLLGQAFEALERRNPKLAEAAVTSDAAIDRLQRELEEQTIGMIARRQPLALDLRQIMATLKVAGDLERVGDLAKNIAKRALAMSGRKPSQDADHGPRAT